MKEFLKYTLATVVGFFIVSILSLFLFIGVVGAIASLGSSETTLTSNSVYQLDLNGMLIDRSIDDPFSVALYDAMGMTQPKNIGLDDVLANIEKAKNNANIVGIYLKGGNLSGGYASMKEIRDALEDFKSTGKFIVAYADNYSQRSYYLASVADEILLNPQGAIDWRGVSAQVMFLKNTLEKLGIEMQVIKVGTFKSAVEPYLNTKMSDENRQQVSVYTHSIWNSMLNDVSTGRNISTENLNTYADELMAFETAEKTLEYKLVDKLVYEDEVEEILKLRISEDATEKHKLVKHSEMNLLPSDQTFDKNKLAVIYAVGGIDDGSTDGIVSEKLIKTINKAAKDESVKAVVLRVNSPGGSAYGSEQIWRALTNLKKEKPLIVSMGDYAASGGYYIACIGDTIVAQPNTLTGSIGIFGVIPNTKGLTDKLGVSFDGVKTNKFSDAPSLHRAFTGEERYLVQNSVNRGYELFVQRCADGRGKTSDEIKKIAEGRVWTGEHALQHGLVDQLGGLNDAITVAAEKAVLETYRVVEYPEKEDFTTRLLNSLNEDVETRIVKATFGEHYNVFKQLKNVEHINGTQARMSYDVLLD